jgi:hypothetical protein
MWSYPSVLAASRYVGSISLGSLFFGVLTRVLTGHATIRSSGYGVNVSGRIVGHMREVYASTGRDSVRTVMVEVFGSASSQVSDGLPYRPESGGQRRHSG